MVELVGIEPTTSSLRTIQSSQKTSIWRALGSQPRSKTVQFRQARRELPHNLLGTHELRTRLPSFLDAPSLAACFTN